MEYKVNDRVLSYSVKGERAFGKDERLMRAGDPAIGRAVLKEMQAERDEDSR